MKQLFMTVIAFVTASNLRFSNGIPIDNAIAGTPEVECLEDSITLNINTKETFQGRIYVLGHADKPECISAVTGRRTTSITVPTLPTNLCGATRLRSADPEGMFINVRVMVSFHKAFITKVDQAWDVSCFYMQADKTVDYPLTVSMRGLNPFTVVADMPRCNYEVLVPETLTPATVVGVGHKLLHAWTCDTPAPDVWCMTVHSCFVEDGAGTAANILDEDGCAVDKFLLGNLEYGPDKLTVTKEAHAFKFADRVVVNFLCSVRLDVKEVDEVCPLPQCPQLRRAKRRAPAVYGSVTEIDVRSRQLDVLDPRADFGVSLNDPIYVESLSRIAQDRPVFDFRTACFSIQHLLIPCSLTLALLCAMSITIFILWRSKAVLKKPDPQY